MPHFNDHKMTIGDQRSLLKTIKSHLSNARTRFVRSNTALKGFYEEAEDPRIKEEIEKLMARLCAAIDTIDGKVIPEVHDE